MVVDPEKIKKVAIAISDIYAWLDQQIAENTTADKSCFACGQCCNFHAYDHRLYVTTPEALCFLYSLKGSEVLDMPDGICPYQKEDKCTVYPFRFAGCRIFCCKGDAEFQNDLSEQALARFKKMCEGFDLPYCYMELSQVLLALSTGSFLQA